MKTKDAAAYELILSEICRIICGVASRVDTRSSDFDELREQKEKLLQASEEVVVRHDRIVHHINRLKRYQNALTVAVATSTETEYRERIRPRSQRIVKLFDEYYQLGIQCLAELDALTAVIREVDNATRRRVRKVFAQRLKEARKERGLTQEQLAAILGTTRDNISAYEQGRNEPPIYLFAEIAKFFGRTLESFLT